MKHKKCFKCVKQRLVVHNQSQTARLVFIHTDLWMYFSHLNKQYPSLQNKGLDSCPWICLGRKILGCDDIVQGIQYHFNECNPDQ